MGASLHEIISSLPHISQPLTVLLVLVLVTEQGLTQGCGATAADLKLCCGGLENTLSSGPHTIAKAPLPPKPQLLSSNYLFVCMCVL